MRREIPLIVISLLLAIPAAAAQGPSAELEQILPDLRPPHEPTTEEQVLFANPIKLQISIMSGLPKMSNAMTLGEAVQVGMTNNPSIKASREGLLSASRLSRAALARLGPSASFSTFFAQSSIDQMLFFMQPESIGSPPMQPVTKGTASYTLFAGYQPLFTGGRLINSLRAARAQQRQSLAAVDMQRVRIALAIKESYWNTALSQERLRVTTDYVKYRQWSTANMKERVDVGKVPKADWLREQAELAKARAELNDRYRDFNVALIKLKAAQGIHFTSLITIADKLDKPLQLKTLDEYLEYATKTNPAVLQAQARLNEMQARRRVAASKYSPQVGLYGLVSNASGKAVGEMESVTGKWGATLGVVGGVTLFDSGARLAELRSASAQVRQQNQELQQAIINASEVVSTSWVELQTAQNNYQLALLEVASAEEDHRLLHARYLVGKAIALEDFDASVKLFQARLRLLEKLYEQQIALARLETASGII